MCCGGAEEVRQAGEPPAARKCTAELLTGVGSWRDSGVVVAEAEGSGLGKTPSVEAELLRWLAGAGGLWQGRSAAALRSLRGGAR